ncbi:MAG TPA: Crp/Fnr family transcriptional regulator [Candidatus Baltobacteraceae bacterium]|jgi:CRP-like cAMP-binding protein|nr:Crp/Fnr family transcriptional regulator [Candidatus Baltobacteraceae bacterium]
MLQNLLLDVLPEHERRRIAPHCEDVQLEQRSTLYEPDTTIPSVWFPNTAVISVLVHTDNGEAVEIGLVGREGMVGIPLVLGCTSNSFHAIAQVGGSATRIARQPFVDVVLAPGHVFCSGLLKYVNLYASNIAQTAACNRLHRIEQRLARWLLDMQDRTQHDVLPVTHEFLGLMVGAYRPSVTNALKAFEDRGVLEPRRGAIRIVDLPALEREACECHSAIRRRTEATLEQIRSLAA